MIKSSSSSSSSKTVPFSSTFVFLKFGTSRSAVDAVRFLPVVASPFGCPMLSGSAGLYCSGMLGGDPSIEYDLAAASALFNLQRKKRHPEHQAERAKECLLRQHEDNRHLRAFLVIQL